MSSSFDRTARIGVIGCGNISPKYFDGMRRFSELEVVGCADLVPALAEKQATAFGITAYPTIEALLADDSIDVVVNITPPVAHADVTEAALRAGKHVYVEKPIADKFSRLQSVLDIAKTAGRVVGGAPDTFLGSANQTARRAIDDGLIGEVIGGTAFLTYGRAEEWHPNPTFLFQPGGGPVLDMGPYYVSGLVNLLGPVESVMGATRIGAAKRVVTTPGRTVDEVEVTTDTHAGALLRFRSGAIVTAMFSFDVWDAELPQIEIYGTGGTLSIPDPNAYDGPIRVHMHTDMGWRELEPVQEPSGDYRDENVQMLRGMGVRDLVRSLAGDPQRTSATLATHVLEVLEAISTSSTSGVAVQIATYVDRPAPESATRLS